MARAKKITLDKDVAKNVQDKLAKLKASASEKFTKSQPFFHTVFRGHSPTEKGRRPASLWDYNSISAVPSNAL